MPKWFKNLFRNRWKELALRREKDCDNYLNAIKQTRFERDEYKRKFEAQCKLTSSMNEDVRVWKERYSNYKIKFENSQEVVNRLRAQVDKPEGQELHS